MKKLYNWIYEKWLDWKLKKVYPNGVSEEEYQMAIRKLLRKIDLDELNKDPHA